MVEANKISLDIEQCASQLNGRLLDQGLMLTTAESCTGGLVSSSITAINGSSSVFDRSFITYSNESKVDMIAVSLTTLNSFGAVSEEVALEMLAGALRNSNASIGVAITGIAGPTGGTAAKPVGTVCFAWGSVISPKACTELFSGDRTTVRELATKFALKQLLAYLQ